MVQLSSTEKNGGFEAYYYVKILAKMLRFSYFLNNQKPRENRVDAFGRFCFAACRKMTCTHMWN